MKTEWIGTCLPTVVAAFAASVWLPWTDCRSCAEEPKGSTVQWKVPTSLKAEHDELHAELVKATMASQTRHIGSKSRFPRT